MSPHLVLGAPGSGRSATWPRKKERTGVSPSQHPPLQLSPPVLLSVPGSCARFHRNRGFGPQTIPKTSD